MYTLNMHWQTLLQHMLCVQLASCTYTGSDSLQGTWLPMGLRTLPRQVVVRYGVGDTSLIRDGWVAGTPNLTLPLKRSRDHMVSLVLEELFFAPQLFTCTKLGIKPSSTWSLWVFSTTRFLLFFYVVEVEIPILYAINSFNRLQS